MCRFLPALSTILFMSCINLQDGIIHNKKWRVVKQVVSTEDKTGTRNEEKKDFMMDKMNFETGNKLIIESYGTADQFLYSITDSTLTFSPISNMEKVWEYGIVTSTKDSLVLKRKEIWGSDSALKITATLYLVPMLTK